MKYILGVCLVVMLVSSCASKKEILYIQDSENYTNTAINFSSPKIQANDILKITVGALVADTAIPYNKPSVVGGASVEIMQLDGYLVSKDNTISFPELGEISTENKTVIELESHIRNLLEEGNHLKNPTVNVRLLNAKVTILGEVKQPGTYNFTEYSISLLQALGYAGDLTINGKRDDIKVIREVDGNRLISTVDITSGEFLNSEFYQIKPNDVIVVNPNNPKVKSAGFVGNTSTVISVVSILLTTIVLITR
ncbi:polysaccharide biosynthesis/export family protein [Psychroserpens algicola]|uniref:Polysaccharide biosynthesis/export family protein n=1 Tax=Psychroserpens algicola TaxID=1719034 RepID=A0ABT0H863_9FLAO|nr:polysaccharide biosynthesis/export family protein [Psychroserpens algicola]MCK8480560.1 polysaccharide biosynthesis/export family protein [Psychroserpens algicola]